MTIRGQSPPSLIGYPKVDFQVGAFNALVWDQGYNITYEEARACPCRTRESGSALPSCQNCRGYGWFFINKVKTKAIVFNINQNPKFIEWSIENAGTMMVSLMNSNKLAEFDRITFMDVVSKWSETLKVRTVGGQKFVFLTYKPSSILDVFYLESVSKPLYRLDSEEYFMDDINEYILLLNFNPLTGFNNTITVTYLCNAAYHVIDLPHDIRSSSIISDQGRIEKIDLPVNAVVRKAHLVLGLTDYDGGIELINNSYR